MAPRLRDFKKMNEAVQRFNADHPVGSRVRAWTGLKGDGPGRVGAVREPGAYVLGGHTPVVHVDGISGCVMLTHVEPAEPADA